MKNVGFLGGNPLKNKWLDLVEKSKNGLYIQNKMRMLREKGEEFYPMGY